MADMEREKDSVNFLWTGGWDSTFQLLRLLLLSPCRVVPYYLIDEQRPSTGMEIRTMHRIKEHLSETYPDTCALLAPTRFFSVAGIAPDQAITDAYDAVLAEHFIGPQYEWLPRFCRENDIENIQLCIHRDDKAHVVLEQMVQCRSEFGHDVFSVAPECEDPNRHLLFERFSFPVFDLTKKQMAEVAAENGWTGIMNMTWFCHTPKRGYIPCGNCNPCHYTIEEGLGWRIPACNRKDASRLETFVARIKIALLRRLDGQGVQ